MDGIDRSTLLRELKSHLQQFRATVGATTTEGGNNFHNPFAAATGLIRRIEEISDKLGLPRPVTERQEPPEQFHEKKDAHRSRRVVEFCTPHEHHDWETDLTHTIAATFFSSDADADCAGAVYAGQLDDAEFRKAKENAIWICDIWERVLEVWISECPEQKTVVSVDLQTNVIRIAGDPIDYGVAPHLAQVVLELVRAKSEEDAYVVGSDIETLPGCRGKNISREFKRLKQKVPPLASIIESGPNGYFLNR